VTGIGAFDSAQCAERIDRQDESAKVLIHASIPGASNATTPVFRSYQMIPRG
jgi:hypothetical protein